VRLTVVGSAPAYTSRPGHASSCYLVEHASTSVLFDMGQGSFSELWRHGSLAGIAAIFISHNHADHNVDLIPLRHWVRYQNRGYGPALFAPTELRARIGAYQANEGFLSDLRGETLAPRTYAVGDVRVEAAPVTHIPDSWAFRVSAASDPEIGLVYSGDCGRADDLLPLVHAGDTLLCEAAFGSDGTDPSGIHLTAAEAARIAEVGAARRLVLTHILVERDPPAARAAAAAIFDGPVLLAEPGLRVNIDGSP